MFSYHHRFRRRLIEGTTKLGGRSKRLARPQHLGAGVDAYEIVRKMKGKLLYCPAGILGNNDVSTLGNKTAPWQGIIEAADEKPYLFRHPDTFMP